MMRFLRYLQLVFLSLMPLAIQGQDIETVDDSTIMDIKVKMLLFKSELSELYDAGLGYLNIDDQETFSKPKQDLFMERMKLINSSLKSFDTRWNTYSQAQQVYIAEDDSLLSWVAEMQEMQQILTDTLASKQDQFDKMVAFTNAEEFILSQDSAYKRMYNAAMQFSLVAKLGAQLEKVKAEEQLAFTSIQTYYDQAKEAVTVFPGLDSRMKVIDDKYVQLKSASAKIQEAAYKPFIQRIKDYLLGLVAVAILLMFFNLLTAKLKTVKQKYEQLKKMKDLI